MRCGPRRIWRGALPAGEPRPSIPWFDHHLLGRPLDDLADRPGPPLRHGRERGAAKPSSRSRAPLHAVPSAQRRAGKHGCGRRPSHVGAAGCAGACRCLCVRPAQPRADARRRHAGKRAGIAVQNDVEARADVLVYTSATPSRTWPPTDHRRAPRQHGCAEHRLHRQARRRASRRQDLHHLGWHPAPPLSATRFVRRADRDHVRAVADQHAVPPRPPHPVEVSSSIHRYDRNPNTGGDITTGDPDLWSPASVHHGPTMPSRIILPVIPR